MPCKKILLPVHLTRTLRWFTHSLMISKRMRLMLPSILQGMISFQNLHHSAIRKIGLCWKAPVKLPPLKLLEPVLKPKIQQYISNSPKTGDGFELVSQSPSRPHNRPVEFPSATPPSESAMESTVLIETMPSTDTGAGAMLYTVEKDDKNGDNVEVVNSWPLTPGFFESTQPSKTSNIHAKINETHTIKPQMPKIDISLRVEALMQDWESRLWFTYTVGFERIKRSIFSSDVGWGCMHRSGQCILSFAFTCVLLGRDWRLNGKHDKDQEAAYRTILSWFHDSSNSYYSIQRIARMGEKLGVKVGQWFSPGTLAHVLRRLSLLHPSCPLRIYVPPVAVLSIPTMLALSEVTITPSNPTSNGVVPTATFWTPLVIFIPVRLGLSDISADFWDNLKTLFTWECCLGIVGGRPKKSFWFVGWEDDNLLYFDPHISRDFDSFNSGVPVHKYHTTQIRSTPLSSIDPSMLLGFLIKSKTELENFLYKVQHELNQSYPLFSVVEHATEWDDDDLDVEDGDGDRKDGGVFMDMMEMEGDSLRSQYSRVEMTEKRKPGKSRKRDDSFEVL
ncbi:hypothetical protein BKA69DRAFT_467748 [Paraphysoderma sedebokerense]|nr:hypothetical protein BKA69DRAFT_467748 [Paraphysoderma sedebokerense]